MFNSDFYPTPRALASKMLQGLDVRNKYVLEPSAGKGDLALATYGAAAVHLIECEPELCAILEKYSDQTATNRERKKGWRLIANDFLSFAPSCDYDVILMNPPFSSGAAHFIHAWNIADGTHIRCLLNAETLRNPHTQERENLAAIIAQYDGTVEYISNAFADAERRTNVEIALISIFKPAKARLNLNDLFSGERTKTDSIGDDLQHTEIATPSYIKNSVAAFAQAKDALKDVFKAIARFNYHAAGCGANKNHNHDKYHKQLFEHIQNGKTEDYNLAVEEMTANAWTDFFRRPNYRKMITSGVQDAFEKERIRRGTMAFNEANLHNFVDTLIGTRGLVMQKAIDDSFDFLTTYNEKNVVHKEGWKTNSHYKVNIKCIVPALHKIDKYGYTGFDYYCSTRIAGIFDDLDRALCFIIGTPFEKMQGRTINQAVSSIIDEGRTADNKPMPADYKTIYERPHESHFFTLRLYKKGTMHLQFKDESLWARFNQAAAEGKNWLG